MNNPDRAAVFRLVDLPNGGEAIASQLRMIGIDKPSQLPGKNPFALYESISSIFYNAKLFIPLSCFSQLRGTTFSRLCLPSGSRVKFTIMAEREMFDYPLLRLTWFLALAGVFFYRDIPKAEWRPYFGALLYWLFILFFGYLGISGMMTAGLSEIFRKFTETGPPGEFVFGLQRKTGLH